MWPSGLRFSSSMFCIYLITNTTLALYNTNWSVFIIEMESIYCTVQACKHVWICRTQIPWYKVQHTQITTAEITNPLTNGKVTVRRCPPLSISFCRFAAMTTMSLPSTSPAPTSSDAIPSAESFPTANSNLMSFNSRFGFLKQKQIN